MMFAGTRYMYVILHEHTDQERAVPCVVNYLVDEATQAVLYVDAKLTADAALAVSLQESDEAKRIAEERTRREVLDL